MKSVTILKTTADWNEWILTVNVLINRYEVKKYVDLIKIEISESTSPTMPEIFEIKKSVTRLTDLDATQLTMFEMMTKRYKITSVNVIKKLNALKFLNTHIIFFINRFNMLYLIDMIIVYQKFHALKAHLASTDKVRKMKIIKRYKMLQKAFKQ